MPPTNDFVPFCNENTGTNLPAQAAYLANPNLPIGNQPGIASSSFNNKPLRQATTIASIIAQYTSNQSGADMLDDQNTADHAVPAKLLAALTAALKYHSPTFTTYTSSSGNHNITYKFQIASGNATVGATYSDGVTTYTVKATIAAGTQLDASGNALPAAIAGTLTKTGGTGDTTITYYAYRKPLYLRVRMVGGGGGGAGAGTTGGTAAVDGGATTFGTTLLNAGGGVHGVQNTGGGGGGAGGSASLGTGPSGAAIPGGFGAAPTPFATGASGAGGLGGVSAFGGAGANGGGTNPSSGSSATANSGSGGGGGGGGTTASSFGGGAGGAGGYVDAFITTVLSTYAWAVGAGGTQGGAGGGAAGAAGGAGANGIIIVEEHYQ